MKKLISFILIMSLFLSLFSCGNISHTENSEENNNKIELTLDNYKDYLNVNALYNVSGDSVKTDYHTDGKIAYPNIELQALVEGVTSNYNYKDVSLTVEVTLSYPYYYPLNTYGSYYLYEGWYSPNIKTCEFDLTLNIAGTGSSTKTLYDFDLYAENEPASNYLEGIYVFRDEIEATYEVTYISGYLEPVK